MAEALTHLEAAERLRVEYRADVAGHLVVTGYAAVFNQPTILGTADRHFLEELAPTAFDQALRDPATDVRALLNHDPNHVLGRQSAGTLTLSTDKIGLRYRVHLPDTAIGHHVYESVRRGDTNGASFGFVPHLSDRRVRRDGKAVRRHLSVRSLRDISIVSFPAYPGTSATTSAAPAPAIGYRSDPRSAAIRARHAARTAPPSSRSDLVKAKARARLDDRRTA